MGQASRRAPSFLPDFCGREAVYTVVVAGQLFAFVLVLARGRAPQAFWQDLALVSLFVQWLGLSSAGLLCLLRPPLARLDNVRAGLVAWVLVVLISAALSEAAHRLVLTGWPGGHLWFVTRNVVLAAIVGAVVMRYLYVQHQWRLRIESESRARVEALQARIRPHFLFNSMNTIASLARSDPRLAEQVTEDLADLFRVSLADARVGSSLGAELELCRRYLRIEAQRLGERLRVELDTGALPADARVPALCLQPLVENAVYHGIERTPGGGLVRIAGTVRGEEIEVRVENTVGGAGSVRPEGLRIALENCRERLAAFFAGEAELTTERGAELFVAALRMPYRKGGTAR